MLLRKPPKPNRLLLPLAFVGADGAGHVLAVGVSLAEGWLFRYRFTALGSSSLSLKATVPAVDRESPESLNDSTIAAAAADALELSIADRHMVGSLVGCLVRSGHAAKGQPLLFELSFVPPCGPALCASVPDRQ